MAHETCQLTRAEINHLRRLLGYIGTDIGQTPEEMEVMIRDMHERLGPSAFTDEGVMALQKSYERAKAVPKYIRAAVTALKKTIKRSDGDIHDVDDVREVLAIGVDKDSA